MEKKLITFAFIAFLSMVFLFGMVNAMTLTSNPSSVNLTQIKLSQDFTLTANGNATSWNLPADQIVKDSNGDEVTLHFDKVSNTNTSQKYNVTVSGAVSNFIFPESKSLNVEFTATNVTNSSDSASKNVSFTFASDYCGTTPNIDNQLDAYVNNVQVLKGYGNNNDWYPLDEVQVEARVVNNGNWDVNNIELRWALYNKRSGKMIVNGREDNFRLRGGDERTINFNLTLDRNVDSLENGDVVLYVRARGEINNFNGAYDGNYTCDSYTDNGINIVSNNDFVIINNLRLNDLKAAGLYNQTLSCGQDLTFGGDLWNIGYYDQNDVTLEIYNKDLGLLKEIPFNNIRSFDSQNFNYNFVIPKNSKEKAYTILLKVLDNNNEVYQSSYRNVVSEKFLSVKVDHCSITEPMITAVLASDAKSGNVMKVNATITNLDTDNVTFSVGAKGYDSWAKLESVSPEVLLLNSGQAKNVQLVFNLNKDSVGDKTFDIITSSNGKVVGNQSVMVSVTKGAFSLKDMFNGFDWKLALIILINFLLIVAIVVVILRLKKKQK